MDVLALARPEPRQQPDVEDLMRWHVSLTWGEWWPHWFTASDYLAIGIGPIFLEFDWGAGRPQWEL